MSTLTSFWRCSLSGPPGQGSQNHSLEWCARVLRRQQPADHPRDGARDREHHHEPKRTPAPRRRRPATRTDAGCPTDRRSSAMRCARRARTAGSRRSARRRRSGTGAATRGPSASSTSSWPSSTPALNDSSDVSRCEPANCSDSRSANEKPRPCTRPKANARIQRRRPTRRRRAAFAGREHDVLERHVDDRRRDERLDQRRKPQPVRPGIQGGRDERHGMSGGERGDREDELAGTP